MRGLETRSSFSEQIFQCNVRYKHTNFKCGLQDLNERVCNYSSKFSKKMAFLRDNLYKHTQRFIIMYKSTFTNYFLSDALCENRFSIHAKSAVNFLNCIHKLVSIRRTLRKLVLYSCEVSCELFILLLIANDLFVPSSDELCLALRLIPVTVASEERLFSNVKLIRTI